MGFKMNKDFDFFKFLPRSACVVKQFGLTGVHLRNTAARLVGRCPFPGQSGQTLHVSCELSESQLPLASFGKGEGELTALQGRGFNPGRRVSGI